MSLANFFDNFAQIADAPNGVAKLRELILQLAVQGKLVSQDPRDEPARGVTESGERCSERSGHRRTEALHRPARKSTCLRRALYPFQIERLRANDAR